MYIHRLAAMALKCAGMRLPVGARRCGGPHLTQIEVDVRSRMTKGGGLGRLMHKSLKLFAKVWSLAELESFKFIFFSSFHFNCALGRELSCKHPCLSHEPVVHFNYPSFAPISNQPVAHSLHRLTNHRHFARPSLYAFHVAGRQAKSLQVRNRRAAFGHQRGGYFPREITEHEKRLKRENWPINHHPKAKHHFK